MSPKISLVSFKFDNFENVQSEVGSFVTSEATDANGDTWKLWLYPGGRNPTDPSSSTFVVSSKALSNRKCTFHIILRNSRGLVVSDEFTHSQCTEQGYFSARTKFLYLPEVLSKEKDMLADGALLIDIMCQFHQVLDSTKLHCTKADLQALPNPFGSNMFKLLESEDGADVSFQIADTIIHAHKLVLKMNSPFLFNLCKGANKDSPILIKGVTPELFRFVLRYIYGGDAPDIETEKKGRDIITAANRFEVIGLKLEVEATLVASCILRVSNVADCLLFAHAKFCPLLKEYAIAFFVARSKDILNSKYFEKLNESAELMKELMLAMSPKHIAEEGIQSMKVDALKKKLFEKGLDVDGSKEMLVSRLQSSNKRKLDE